MVFLVSIIALRGKEMNKQIEMIVKDLAVLKSEMPASVMIGQLRFLLSEGQSKLKGQAISWRLKKRQVKGESYYRVHFNASHTLLEAVFMSTDTKPEANANAPRSMELADGERRITPDEINHFLVEANDPNSIHRGEIPVVPGLMLLEKMLMTMSDEDGAHCKCQIKFIEPLFANQGFTIKKTENIFHIINRMGDSIAILTLEGNNE